MDKVKENSLQSRPIKKLIWHLGLPMIVSMVLQALYNVIDSIFVANINDVGQIANEALTYAFPIQILMIALGVGTGVGINSLLSKSFGENNKEKVNKIAGNGIFLSIVIFILFLFFGLFGSKWFISLFTKDESVINYGYKYLQICTVFSFGSIGYSIYERYLQSTGKTLYSMISQVSGALINIIFDYIFIFPMKLNVEGAALATIFGQFVSLVIAMSFHYFKNKEINGHIKYIKPDFKIIKEIYSIGLSAILMQGLLSIMMAGMNLILANAKVDTSILVGSFGIYYKIQQIALFSCFGLSNTIITILSFNYGMNNKERCQDCIKYGIIDTVIVMFIITILFEIIARPLSMLFSLSSTSSNQLIDTCEKAVRIASIGFIFMGFNVAVQGVFQALRYPFRPLFTALLRLVIFVFPLAFLFTLSDKVLNLVWLTFPISELLTTIVSFFLLKDTVKKKIKTIEEPFYSDKLLITISREHGTNAKEFGRKLANEINIKFYDKELLCKEAIDKNNNLTDENEYELYKSFNVTSSSILAQKKIIEKLASENDLVIVGRCADYILRNCSKLVKVFLYASDEYRINNVMKMYNDSKDEAIKNIKKSDENRKKYYFLVTNNDWSNKNNYDLYLDVSNGNDVINTIKKFIKDKNYL